MAGNWLLEFPSSLLSSTCLKVYLNVFIYLCLLCMCCKVCIFIQLYFTVSLFGQEKSESRPLEGHFSVYRSVFTLLAPFSQFEAAPPKMQAGKGL